MGGQAADAHPVGAARAAAPRGHRRARRPRPGQGDRPGRRAPARHDLPPAAHLHPRGLAAAPGRRHLRARPPHRRRPRAGTAAAGVALARPALEWLRDELGGAVYLARYVDGEIVVVEIVDSARAPRIDLWVGVHDAGARDRARQMHPRPAHRGRARRLPVPASAARPDPAHRRRPPPAAAARTGRGRRRRRGVRAGGLLPGRAGRRRRTASGRSAWSSRRPRPRDRRRDALLAGAGRISRALALR